MLFRSLRRDFFEDLSPQTRQAVGAVIVGVLGIFFVLSAFEYAGVAGSLTYKTLSYFLGVGFILAPIACALYVYILLRPREDTGLVSISKAIGIAVLLFSILGLLALYGEGAGGLGGTFIATPLTILFGDIAEIGRAHV